MTSSKNDKNYYFKNSYPAEPYITVPKNRVTYIQYKTLENHINQNDIYMFHQDLANFQQKLQQVVDYPPNMQPNGTYWTIYDDLYAISIYKK